MPALLIHAQWPLLCALVLLANGTGLLFAVLFCTSARFRQRLVLGLCEQFEKRLPWVRWLRRGWVFIATIYPFMLTALYASEGQLSRAVGRSLALGFFVSGLFVWMVVSDLIEQARCLGLLDAILSLPWQRNWDERTYQRNLVEGLHDLLGARQKAEFPISSGTRVDLWLSYRGLNWYVTTKRGMDNQKRLTLQGEVEDILAHVRSLRQHYVGLIFIVGVTEQRRGEQQMHIDSLEERINQRLEFEEKLSRRRRQLLSFPLVIEIGADAA